MYPFIPYPKGAQQNGEHHQAGQQQKPDPNDNGGKAKPKAESKPKRPTYRDNVKAIADRARGLACPETKQGPVPTQATTS